ncbi:MAG: methionyl-tRNA formyltransferase [Lachnospiraceae bacterium]
MRVIFMGTPDFAVETLNRLIAGRHEVVLAVTQPDKPRGRGKEVSFSPVKEAALKAGVEVFQPVRIKEPDSVRRLRDLHPDVIVVVAFGQILSKEILDIPRYGCINVHGSLLPKYRGAAPIQWAVLNGDERSGVTTMKMDEGLDTGDIIMKREIMLDPDETAGSLFDRLQEAGAELLMETLDALEEGSAVYTPQEEEKATKTRLISKKMGKMDFEKPAQELERLVRGMNPWPSAYCSIHGKVLKIWKSSVANSEEEALCEEHRKANEKKYGDANKGKNCGQIICVTRQNIYVQTGKGVLRLDEVQIEGKRRMSCEEFLRGYPVEEGINL